MKKYEVEFMGGESRNGQYAVNYMMVVVDGTELYAEYDLRGVEDEDAGYDELKAEIIAQAKEQGVDVDSLIF